jgi:lysozyme family protein
MPEPEIPASPPTESELAAEERALKHDEFVARREEAKAKLAATTTPWWRGADPLVLAVVAGVFTLAGNTFLAYYNAQETIKQETTKATNALSQEERKAANDLSLEREKAKATLILQAVSTNDPATARRNMLFFLDGGLIEDDDNKIHAALEKYSPVLPSASGRSSRPPPNSSAAYDDYLSSAGIRPEWLSQVDGYVEKLISAKPRLERVAQVVHTPWYIIGVLWYRETDCDFSKHLHNGDRLTRQTVRVPAGRPLDWPPPPGVDPWEYSATDAIRFYKLNDLNGLQIGEILARLERLNGMGYQKQGVFSPYLWAGTDLYEKGMYIAGSFMPDAVPMYPGIAPLLIRLQVRGIIDLHKVEAAATTPPQIQQ